MEIGVGIGVVGSRTGAFNWSALWASLISAVVNSANPTKILMTFSKANTSLVHSDFTVSGYTTSGLTRDATNKILTLTCTTNVLATTVTLNKGTGLTTPVMVELARNTDSVICSGYYTVQVPGSDFGAFANTARSFLNRNNLTKIRQNGNITQVKFYIGDLTDVTELFFDVWRKDGATWDRVTHSDIYALSTADIVNTVTLPAPVAVLEGDFVGLSGKQTTNGFNVLDAIAFVGGSYLVNLYPTAFDRPWDTYTAWNFYLPIQTYIQAPLIVGIGDSIMAGHGANYSNIENSIIVHLDYHIMSQMYILNSKYIFQNMGIGSNTSALMVARFTADVINIKPKIAIIGGFLAGLILGENNATMIANATTMINACVANGIVPVVCKINPWTNGTNGQMQTRDAIMVNLQSLVATYSSAVWVDFDETIGKFRVGGDPGNLWDIQTVPDYDDDGVHLNQAGYTAMAGLINSKIIEKYTFA